MYVFVMSLVCRETHLMWQQIQTLVLWCTTVYIGRRRRYYTPPADSLRL